MRKVEYKSKVRIIAAFFIIGALLTALMFRTAWIQIVRADEYTEKAIEQQTSDIPLEAKRGSVYDRNGKELATSATCYSVWIRPAEIRKAYPGGEKQNEISAKLASALNMNSAVIRKYFAADDALIQIAKYLEKDQIDRVRALDITGLETAEGMRRYYPLKTEAARLLGSVNDDNEGRSGIEAQFDSYLAGVPGRWIKETDLNGNALAFGNRKLYSARDGYNLTLTIDEVLQHFAETAIEKGMKQTKAKRIMCLVMNPKTGDVLAMATAPSFDPNDATEPVSAADRNYYQKLSSEEKSAYLSSMWRNPVISDVYEPGSTFKLVTTSAALEEGVTTLKSRYYDSGSINVSGITLHCWQSGGHGSESLIEAVGNSCNPVQVQLVQKLGKEKYYNYLDMFGITDLTDIDLPGEAKALVKSRETLGSVDLATMAYGQGIAVTPIQLLTAVNAIGNGGVIMKPRIVSKMTDSSGKTVETFPEEKVRQVISEKTASEMKTIMEYVVSEGGATTAKIPGYRIGGKTGTANKASGGGYSVSTNSSFVGMAPMDDPRITVLVVVDTPKGETFGSVVAAPIARDFFNKALPYLNVEKNYSGDDVKQSSGSMVQVPKLTGMSSEKAAAAAKNSGLEPVYMPEGTKGDFKVADQYPKAGKVVRKKTKVYLYKE